MKPLKDAAEAALVVEKAFTVIKSTSKVRPIAHALEEASQSLSSVITDLRENHKRQFLDVRKRLVALNNSVDGMLAGVAGRDISSTQLRTTALRVSEKFLEPLASSISSTLEGELDAPELNERQKQLKSELSLSLGNKGMDQALSAFLDMKTGTVKLNLVSGIYRSGMPDDSPEAHKYEDQATQKLREQIKVLREELKEMPTRMKGNFKMYQFPIIPTFKQDKSFLVDSRSGGIDKLRRIGISALGVEGYAVMMNQKVLTISKKFCTAHGLEPKKAAVAILDLIRERGHANMVLVSDKHRHCPNNSDLLMFWVMPPAQLDAFGRIAHGLADMVWAFPA